MRFDREISDPKLAEWLQNAPEEELVALKKYADEKERAEARVAPPEPQEWTDAMRTNKPSTASGSVTAAVGRVHEDGLSTDELTALVSVPGAWGVAGSADEVCDRVTQRLREAARK
ncbi:hypothetical protein [Rhodospirillum sp. A1_3_36]|uniref:hypothetical protein n=1 Tax=Rhodospirillum sp. A1_3_36 TaxID=3391666 RepID=UPI0039A77CD6